MAHTTGTHPDSGRSLDNGMQTILLVFVSEGDEIGTTVNMFTADVIRLAHGPDDFHGRVRIDVIVVFVPGFQAS